MKLFKLIACLACVAFVGVGPAMAASKKDLETISRAVGFINGGPSGAVEMAIVYDPSNADSVAHADEVAALTASGLGAKVKLTGSKVAAGSVGGTSAPVIFLTRGAGAAYGSALSKAQANGGLTVSTDEACLTAGCVMVVKTKPSVEILVSTAASEQVGVEFASAFSMMITKR